MLFMKKKRNIIIVVVILCAMIIAIVILNQYTVSGVIESINGREITINVESSDSFIPTNADKIVFLYDKSDKFTVGDEVTVLSMMSVLESYPPRIEAIYIKKSH